MTDKLLKQQENVCNWYNNYVIALVKQGEIASIPASRIRKIITKTGAGLKSYKTTLTDLLEDEEKDFLSLRDELKDRMLGNYYYDKANKKFEYKP